MNNFRGQVDGQIERLRTTLLELQQAFLNHAALKTEITVFQILDDVGVLSAHVDGISTRLDAVSNQVSDLGM